MLYRAHASVKPVPSYPGVRSPPLQERRSKVRWPRGGKPGDGVEGGFLGGTHSVRPRCEAPRMPRHSICSRWADDEPVAKRAHASVKPVPSYPGVRSPPLRGGGQPEKTALPRKAGDGAERGFLGGTRSPRPHCKAVRKPRHNMIMGGQTNARWRRGTIPRWKPSLPYRTCRARPSAGGPSPARLAWRGDVRWPCEERILRRDALCASVLQGRTRTEALDCTRWVGGSPWSYDHIFRFCPGFARGRAEPAPPRGYPN